MSEMSESKVRGEAENGQGPAAKPPQDCVAPRPRSEPHRIVPDVKRFVVVGVGRDTYTDSVSVIGQFNTPEEARFCAAPFVDDDHPPLIIDRLGHFQF